MLEIFETNILRVSPVNLTIDRNMRTSTRVHLQHICMLHTISIVICMIFIYDLAKIKLINLN